ncbi:MAG: dicarboxylate/amino acid:cation symporter [Gemmatimonadaceae bacterium]|nr:dicarboxylate/amino acid:cation symporter [Gemmatimonadaceae bacterium]
MSQPAPGAVRAAVRSQGVQVSMGLVAGLAIGMALSRDTDPSAAVKSVVAVLDTIGTAWINAVRMTVIPLVVPLLIVGVAGGDDARTTGRVGARAFAWMLGMLVACAIFSALAAKLWWGGFTVDPAASERLRASAHIDVPAGDALSARTWFLSLIPLNPVKAAADGTLLPVVLFTLLYAFALSRVNAEPKKAQLAFFRGMADTMLIVVRWLLALAGIGIFCLALVLGEKLGTAALGAIGFYFLTLITLLVVPVIACYGVIAVTRRVPLARFARAALPAQMVGVGSRSSLAALPAMVKGATDVLKLPATATGFVLPLCASVFKLNSGIYWAVGAYFTSKLYGLPLSEGQLAIVALAGVVLSFSTPGIPSGGQLLQVPVYTAIGLPVEAVGIMIALDTLPDMFKTLLNVTSDMVVAVMTSPPAEQPGAA